ncbi:MAG: hypothetical protein IPH11_09965 [Ignavibacteriales bacterium]|nr:hypothetical protein [Ignavibacteriales bacterium]
MVLIEISFVNGRQKISAHKFPELFEDDIPSGFVSLAFYVENNFPKTIWIGGGNTLFKNNFEQKLLYGKSTSFKSLIRKVSVKETSFIQWL